LEQYSLAVDKTQFPWFFFEIDSMDTHPDKYRSHTPTDETWEEDSSVTRHGAQ
jgi:hypothetical protein